MTEQPSSPFQDRVTLDLGGIIGYYSAPIALIGISSALIYRELHRDNVTDHTHPLLWVAALCILAAGLLAWNLRQRLGFVVLVTKTSATVNFRKIVALIEKEEWLIRCAEEGQLIQVRIRAGWSDLTWGEFVTVMFAGSEVAVNCIGDPYGGGLGSRLARERADTEMRLIRNALELV